jgi:GNAT superfamily N-acetyltransferase
MTPLITLTDRTETKVRTIIENGLSRYNRERAGHDDYRGLNVLVSDPETHEVLGGILGHTSLGLCFIDLVFLPEQLRGQDVGTRIMTMAEEEARRRGCRAAVLYTISFQAPGFYEKRGYRAFGKIDGEAGVARIFMVKDL